MIGRKQKNKRRIQFQEESQLTLYDSCFHLQWLGRWAAMTGQALMTCHPCRGGGMGIENHTKWEKGSSTAQRGLKKEG